MIPWSFSVIRIRFDYALFNKKCSGYIPYVRCASWSGSANVRSMSVFVQTRTTYVKVSTWHSVKEGIKRLLNWTKVRHNSNFQSKGKHSCVCLKWDRESSHSPKIRWSIASEILNQFFCVILYCTISDEQFQTPNFIVCKELLLHKTYGAFKESFCGHNAFGNWQWFRITDALNTDIKLWKDMC